MFFRLLVYLIILHTVFIFQNFDLILIIIAIATCLSVCLSVRPSLAGIENEES